MFGRIKRFYDRGLWTFEQVKVGVLARAITEAEFKEITGEDYVA